MHSRSDTHPVNLRPTAGAVACGHPVTRDAATQMLEAGGNAFDAAAAALWAACVAEPLLASPGGGGFLLARPRLEEPRLYDFFAHTPRGRRPPEEVEFREVLVDFGAARQAFHIGLGSAATPGMVAGLFAFHRELGRIPMGEVAAPAVAAAREGVVVSPMQAYVASILAPILEATEPARAVFAPGGGVASGGEVQRLPELADLIEELAVAGPDPFYRGKVAAKVDRACRTRGGHLKREDFEEYEVKRRRPLSVEYGGRRLWTNPPPASGGLLVAFGLRVLAALPPDPDAYGIAEAERMALALTALRDARREEGLEEEIDVERADRVLAPETAARYLSRVQRHPPSRGGTTHISVIDGHGNAAAVSVSNGEGCGWVIPDTGFMLNNVLGESDLQPRGFGRWPPNTRLTSMMAPTLAEDRDGSGVLALGSGGSNRIRSAILQVLAGVLDLDLSLEAAIARPRLHVEADRLEIEGGFGEEVVRALTGGWPNHGVWPGRNLFFGGVHAVAARGPRFVGAGDPRRGGVAAIAPGR